MWQIPPNYILPNISTVLPEPADHMNDKKLTKQVHSSLVELSHQGFNTWATDALKLVSGFGLDISMEKNIFADKCKEVVKHNFTSTWSENLQNSQLYPLLRTYRTFKHDYVMEPYLYLVKKHTYRQAIAKFRCSSQTLEIERGRHTNPKTPVADRKCLFCGVIEDEKHFLLNCCVNVTDREYFYHKISHIHDRFMGLNDEEKFIYILTNRNP